MEIGQQLEANERVKGVFLLLCCCCFLCLNEQDLNSFQANSKDQVDREILSTEKRGGRVLRWREEILSKAQEGRLDIKGGQILCFVGRVQV